MHIDVVQLDSFCTRWLRKAKSHDGPYSREHIGSRIPKYSANTRSGTLNLAHSFDRFTSLYVAFSRVYTEVGKLLIAKGQVRPPRLGRYAPPPDRKTATSYVVDFYGLRTLQTEIQADEPCRTAVDALVDLIGNGHFLIENKGGHRLFYAEGKPLRRESDLLLLFRLTWFATPSDVGREVNDGRGPVDFKISRGALDKSLVEFKLASNTKLQQNLEKQVEVYKSASDAPNALKVILFFSDKERSKVFGILRALGLEESGDIVMIDGRADNKPPGSRA
jgi:hypothetical protein